MPIDPLGKAILETLMTKSPTSANTLRRIAQRNCGGTAQGFWQRLATFMEMGMVRYHVGIDAHEITDKGRQFYLNDGVVDTEPMP